MLNLAIPGFKTLSLEHLVLDYNGTLAVDGRMLSGVYDRLHKLASVMRIHVVTADTFGRAREELGGLPAELAVLGPGSQAEAKLAYVRKLGAERVVAIGNGRNDRLMLGAAALSIAVSSLEGTAVEALTAAHLYLPSVHEALDLLERSLRLTATLRS
jgi:soluble P-type ATPase